MNKKPNLYMMIGVPGSGKSSWIKNQEFWMSDCAYISTDKYVEEYAESVGKTYTEVFEEHMPIAVAKMADAVNVARDEGKNIIWDQTSITISSRAKKFRMLPEYYAIAVVFRIPGPEELQKRLANRPGKVIPSDVLQSMIDGWQEPTEDEGFKEIWKVP
jgi:predicted kinase